MENKNIYHEMVERYEYVVDYFNKNPKRVRFNRDSLDEVFHSLGYVLKNSKDLKVKCFSLQNIIKQLQEQN